MSMTHSSQMTDKQKALVKSTWRKVIPIAPQAATLFYENLFRINPSLQSLFTGTDMPAQKEKLMHAIAAVVDSIDRIDKIQPLLEELGRLHTGYGVVDSHYGDVGSALIQTLEAGLGDEWTEPVHHAWLATYTMVVSIMQGHGLSESA